MTETYIVDTNVAVIANNRPGENDRGPECTGACARFVVDMIRSGIFVIDDNWEILKEYKSRLDEGGQPGLGDKFLKWVLTNRENAARCRKVNTRSTEVPPVLSDFDPSDMKFIRVAVEAVDVPLVEASDSKWWHRQQDFADAGIIVQFLCPDDIRETSERKFGKEKVLGKASAARKLPRSPSS